MVQQHNRYWSGYEEASLSTLIAPRDVISPNQEYSTAADTEASRVWHVATLGVHCDLQEGSDPISDVWLPQLGA